MRPQKSRSPKIKEFVQAPFIKCPDCGNAKTFGVLMICDQHYVRRCTACWFDQSFSLPNIRKAIIYLDQFVISNMMKELDPARSPSSKGQLNGYYRQLFESLDRLCKLQLIACPDSPIQEYESVVDSRYEKIRSVFRHFSHGVSFPQPERLFNAQTSLALKSWLRGSNQVEELSQSWVLRRSPHVWQETYRIELTYRNPELAPELRARSVAVNEALRKVCAMWKNDENFDFDQILRDEQIAHAKTALDQYFGYSDRLTRVHRGEAELTDDVVFPPSGFLLISRLLDTPGIRELPQGLKFQKLGAFFQSELFASIPTVQIPSLFWASIAREVRSGRSPSRYPRAGMFNDVNAVGAYAPFCDAMFVDKEIAHFASQKEMTTALCGKARLFSLRESGAFLQYLNSIEASAPAEHLKIASEVYGDNFATPFTELLSKI